MAAPLYVVDVNRSAYGYPSDLRWNGYSTEVKVTRPDGTVYYQEARIYEDYSIRERNYKRLRRDLKIAERMI